MDCSVVIAAAIIHVGWTAEKLGFHIGDGLLKAGLLGLLLKAGEIHRRDEKRSRGSGCPLVILSGCFDSLSIELGNFGQVPLPLVEVVQKIPCPCVREPQQAHEPVMGG